MRKTKRAIAGILAAGLLLGSVPFAAAADGATRGEVARMVLAAADDYNPGVKLEDILQGDDSGDLRENEVATRAEALVSGHSATCQRRWATTRAQRSRRAILPTSRFGQRKGLPMYLRRVLSQVRARRPSARATR